MKNQTKSHRCDILLGDSRSDRPIRFRALKDIYWDDWGRLRRAFVKGRVYGGVLHSDGEITGNSPYYKVSDYVDSNDVEVIG